MGRGEREPGEKWTARDWSLAQALTQYEALLCPGCGHPMHESMNPENDGRYTVPPPSRCYACSAVERVIEAGTYDKASQPHALRFSAELSLRSRQQGLATGP